MANRRRSSSLRGALVGLVLAACATAGGASLAPAPSSPRPAARGPAPTMRFATGIAPPGFTVSEARRERLAAAMPEVEAYLAKHFDDAGCPGAAFGLVLGDDVLWSKGYGVRDMRSRQPVDADTVFRLGSVTKTLTGVALLMLRDDGTVDFDEPIATWIPEAANIVYPTTDSPPITPRLLVTHASGLPRLPGFDYTKGDHEITEKELLEALDGLNLESVPGVRVNYSNLGFALAGLVVERASGKRFRDFVSERLLTPLGMTSSWWAQSDVPPARLATGYAFQNNRRLPTPHWRLGAMEAMGGLYASTRDLLRFASFELSAWPPRDGAENGLVPRRVLRESQLTAGDGWSRDQGVGVAWAVRHDPVVGHLVAHTGSVGNYAASVRLLPERQLGIVGLCSTGDAPERLENVVHEALAMVVRHDPEPSKPISGPLEAAVKRIEEQLAQPQLASLGQAFAPSFLAELTASQVLVFFTEAKKQSGRCTSHRGISSEGLYGATVQINCEKQSWRVTVKTSAHAPFLIEAMWFNPAGRE